MFCNKLFYLIKIVDFKYLKMHESIKKLPSVTLLFMSNNFAVIFHTLIKVLSVCCEAAHEKCITFSYIVRSYVR